MKTAEQRVEELLVLIDGLIRNPPQYDRYSEDRPGPDQMMPAVYWPKEWLLEVIKTAMMDAKREAVREFIDGLKEKMEGLK